MLSLHRQKLAAYQAIERRDFVSSSSDRRRRLQHLVLKAGVDFERQRIAFYEDALSILEDDG